MDDPNKILTINIAAMVISLIEDFGIKNDVSQIVVDKTKLCVSKILKDMEEEGFSFSQSRSDENEQ